MIKLTRLDLSNNPITDLTPIKDFKLSKLKLSKDLQINISQVMILLNIFQPTYNLTRNNALELL